MSLTAKAETRLADSAKGAHKKLINLARKEAAGRKMTDADVAAFAECSCKGNVTSQEFDTWVGIVRRAEQLRVEAARIPELQEAALIAARDRIDFDAETDAIIEQRQQEAYRLKMESHGASVARDDAIKARAALQLLEAEHPELLDANVLTQADLDKHTLTCRGAVIAETDPDAPFVEVPKDVFDAQIERRIELRMPREREAEERYHEWHMARKVLKGDPPNPEITNSVERWNAAVELVKTPKPSTIVTWRDIVRELYPAFDATETTPLKGKDDGQK